MKQIDTLNPLGDIVIVGDFSNIADGETWKGTIYPAGVYHDPVSGRTVRRWATTPERARKLAEK